MCEIIQRHARGVKCVPRSALAGRKTAFIEGIKSRAKVTAVGVLFLSAWLLSSTGAWANSIQFQGRITDRDGQPRSGETRVRFEVYDALSGGTKLWPAQVADGAGEFFVTTNEAGLFSLEIGPFSDTFFSADNAYFVQMAVDDFGFQVMAPRKEVHPVPIAFAAKTASHANEATRAQTSEMAEMVADGSVGPHSIRPASINSDHLMQELLERFLPIGMIAMFAGACPSGWGLYSEMQGHFPLGVTPDQFSGVQGGSPFITGLTTVPSGVHTHVVPPHDHEIDLRTNYIDWGPRLAGSGSGHDATTFHDHTVRGDTKETDLTPDESGTHVHTIESDGSWLPPYIGIVFCEKN